MQISLHGRAKTDQLKVHTASFTHRALDADGLMSAVEGLIFHFYHE